MTALTEVPRRVNDTEERTGGGVMPRRLPQRALGLLLLIWTAGLAEPARAQDPSTRFPRRREGGGTRSGCAARLLVPLQPAGARASLGVPPRLGLIEGDTPQPVPLVLRFGARRLLLPARPGAALRLVALPATLPAHLAAAGWNGQWESYPACEGEEEPVAPPALGWLRPPSPTEHTAGDRAGATAIQGLWQHCGRTVATAAVLARFGYAHLGAVLPERLPVVCEAPLQPPAGSSPSTSSHTSRLPLRPASWRSPQERQLA
ncbi:MAG: hypothetical protein ACK5UG_02850 [Synechococcaceae cyanobacterium]